MSAAVMRDSMMRPVTGSKTVPETLADENDVDFVTCDCCGLIEECTSEYIKRIRERYQGKWICGLCAEAVKDEIARSESLIGIDEALMNHMSFCEKFSSASPPPNPAVHLISVMRQILRRSLDSRGAMRSMPSSPTNRMNHHNLARSGSCMPSLSTVDDSDSQGCPSIEEGTE